MRFYFNFFSFNQNHYGGSQVQKKYGNNLYDYLGIRVHATLSVLYCVIYFRQQDLGEC
jgi:hypothetical protein